MPLFSLQIRRLRKPLIHVYKYLMVLGKEDGMRLFPVVHRDSTLRNGHRKFHLNTHTHKYFNYEDD